MATDSYPAVGNGGFTEVEYAAASADQDGIIQDTMAGGVQSFAITYNNGTNTAHIGPGMGNVNGYTLVADSSGVDLFMAAASSTPITYYVAIKYDPALNVADGSGNASAQGPCRLIVDTALSTTGGESYTLLYKITRSASQLLSAAAVLDYRRWTGPTLALKTLNANATGSTNYSRGTTLIQADTGEISVRDVNAAGTALEWRSLTHGAPVAWPTPAGLTTPTGQVPAAYSRSGSLRFCQGSLVRTSGANLNTGSAVVLGTLPVGDRPTSIRRFICFATHSSGDSYVGIKVDSAGVVTMYDPPANVAWVDLSAITFRTV